MPRKHPRFNSAAMPRGGGEKTVIPILLLLRIRRVARRHRFAGLHGIIACHAPLPRDRLPREGSKCRRNSVSHCPAMTCVFNKPISRRTAKIVTLPTLFVRLRATHVGESPLMVSHRLLITFALTAWIGGALGDVPADAQTQSVPTVAAPPQQMTPSGVPATYPATDAATYPSLMTAASPSPAFPPYGGVPSAMAPIGPERRRRCFRAFAHRRARWVNRTQRRRSVVYTERQSRRHGRLAAARPE